ncbi:hypothetical protein OFO10_06655 [Campylobacter sp. VBCF_06 NA8]|uniref:hypothetical protein n=1 Tax=Campylobacter sp. VBCF_06 NA8 TaxID=2983822 RepID=UPI0022E9EDBD|nr:hypothetical protein [Campylobacter sp. VBCF_06 NA8]MDA3046834.1 hypothetical protein [Campylobacter sp. VBCF_06 NA8]
MSILNTLVKVADKVGDLIKAPMDLLCDWGHEPLKKREHERELEKETNIMRTKAELKKQDMLLKTDIEIKKATEIKRIEAEIQELQKDKDLARYESLMTAIVKYKKSLLDLNTTAINSLNNMQIDTKDKILNLIAEKQQKFENLSKQAKQEIYQDIKQIKDMFCDDVELQNELIKPCIERLSSVVKEAQGWVEILQQDLLNFNKQNEHLITQGHKFIEEHINKQNLGNILTFNQKMENQNIEEAEIIENKISYQSDI